MARAKRGPKKPQSGFGSLGSLFSGIDLSELSDGPGEGVDAQPQPNKIKEDKEGVVYRYRYALGRAAGPLIVFRDRPATSASEDEDFAVMLDDNAAEGRSAIYYVTESDFDHGLLKPDVLPDAPTPNLRPQELRARSFPEGDSFLFNAEAIRVASGLELPAETIGREVFEFLMKRASEPNNYPVGRNGIQYASVFTGIAPDRNQLIPTHPENVVRRLIVALQLQRRLVAAVFRRHEMSYVVQLPHRSVRWPDYSKLSKAICYPGPDSEWLKILEDQQ